MWQYLSQLHWEDLPNTHGMICNPAWHPSQKGYPGGLYGISVDNFTPEMIVNATITGILRKFSEAIALFDNLGLFTHPPTKYKLAGGIAEKLPLVKEYFEQYQVPVEMIPHATFVGLERIQKTLEEK